MSLFDRKGDNIDPFNAGEPVMPWDDPEAMHDDVDECAFDGSPYEAPKKQVDDFQPATEHSESFDRSIADSNKAQVENARKAARERNRKSRVKTQEKPVYGALRNDPQQPEATDKNVHRRKRVLLIVVLVIVVFNLFSALITSCTSLISTVASDIFDAGSTHSGATEASKEDYGDMVDDKDREDNAMKLVTNRATSMLDDKRAMDAQYVTRLDDELKNDLGYTSAELGINTDDFCTWASGYTTVSVGSAYAYEDATVVYFDTTYPYISQVDDAFCSKAEKYLEKQGLQGSYSDSAHGDKLDDAQKAHMRSIFAEALKKMDKTFSGTGRVVLTKHDGDWTINNKEFAKELYQSVGLY